MARMVSAKCKSSPGDRMRAHLLQHDQPLRAVQVGIALHEQGPRRPDWKCARRSQGLYQACALVQEDVWRRYPTGRSFVAP